MEQKLRVRSKLKWAEPLYWLEGKGTADGPFCQKCYDTEDKLVRVQGNGSGHYQCMACSSQYVTPERRAQDTQSIRSFTERKRPCI